MYEYLEGTLHSLLPEALVLDIGGIGFLIHTPKTCSARCAPIGQKLKVFVDLVIREDAHSLYGFSSTQERDFFRLLQQVSGIGPKVALNILSHAPVQEIASTLLNKDAKALSSVPGIGKKLAERLILELYEKIEGLGTIGGSSALPAMHDAVQALQTLGFSAAEARLAVASAQKTLPKASTEQLIQHALVTKR